MVKTFFSKIYFLGLLALLSVQSVYAQGTGGGSAGSGGTGGGGAGSVRMENYLSVDTIQDLLVAILNIVIILMIPIIVFFIILAGFKYVTARGNASQVEEATRALTYAIIGGVLVLGAVALSEIIANVVGQFSNTTP